MASKVPTVCLASLNYLHKQLSVLLVPSTEEGWLIYWYLGEIFLHQPSMAEGTVPWDAKDDQ
jgi:hypothetical protein